MGHVRPRVDGDLLALVAGLGAVAQADGCALGRLVNEDFAWRAGWEYRFDRPRPSPPSG